MKKVKFTKEYFMLSLILILSAVLNFTNLSIEDYANQYYAASVKSMTMSLKNFFFVSFDPGSFVSIDKPPLGFWIQAISAKIFGFSTWSILLPQALAGVISVALIYHLVKRSFGANAGLISALCLATTPVFVAVSRNNTVDNLLVLVLLLACLALSKAAEKGKLKYLMISLALVGVGFNIKMLQAYMVVPALYITYLLSSAVSVKKRVMHLILGTIILVFVSLSWGIVVDLTPKTNRPFVGSSTNNTVMELIFGHNGLERLGIGGSSTPGGGNKNMNGQMPAMNDGNFKQGMEKSEDNNNQPPNMQSSMPPNMPGNDGQDGESHKPGDKNMQPGDGRGNGGGGTFGGQEKASITRLFSKNSLSDQIIWLLPLALFGFAAAAVKEKLGKPFDNNKKLSLVLWFMFLLPEFIYFSYTKGLFHPYYLTMLSAPIAALTGIGITSMWELYKDKEGGWKAWTLPVALAFDGLTQILILSYYYTAWNMVKFIMLVVSILCFVSSAILSIYNIKKFKEGNFENISIKVKRIALTTALIGLLLTPTIWSSTAMFYKSSGTFPAAGVSLMSSKGMGMDNLGGETNEKLIQFLLKNKTSEKYLVAVPSAMGAASDIIIKTGEPVMTLGGFSGSDKILTLNEFKKLVDEGVVRYALVNGGGGPGGNNEITNWITKNGTAVTESEYTNSTSSSNNGKSSDSENRMDKGFGGRSSGQLYDLKPSKPTSSSSK